MPKVCLITRNLTPHNKVWTQVLRHLGIDYTLCVATSGGVGATIQTPQGALAANSADLRNYFRLFDAVICCDHAGDPQRDRRHQLLGLLAQLERA
jgi:hypothetical protein